MQELPRKSSRSTPAFQAPWIVLEAMARFSRRNSAGIGAVGLDAADLRGGDDRDVGLLRRAEGRDRGLARQVQLRAVRAGRARSPGSCLNRRTSAEPTMPAVACDEELCHGLGSFAICDSRLARSRSWSTMIFTSSLKRTFGLPAELLARPWRDRRSAARPRRGARSGRRASRTSPSRGRGGRRPRSQNSLTLWVSFVATT